jgi:SAM-dependent methyltransferase
LIRDLPAVFFTRSPQKTFTKEFEPYVEHYFSRPEFAYFKAEEGRFFRQYIGSLSSPSLEIGYEDGRVSFLHMDGHQFDFGLEYDAAVAGKTPLFPNYRSIVTGSFARMPFADSSIGGIVAVHVLDHVSDLDSALAEAARVLKPGGQIIFSLFSQHAPSVISPTKLAAYDLHHFYDEPSWQRRIASHGLQLTDFHEFTRSRKFLRIYFLGLRGLIPHDRSLVFRIIREKCPPLYKLIKRVLKRVTYGAYWNSFAKPDQSTPGFNVFIVARKIHHPGAI